MKIKNMANLLRTLALAKKDGSIINTYTGIRITPVKDGKWNRCCPLTYILLKRTGDYLSLNNFDKAGERLGLNKDECKAIVRAADFTNLSDKDTIHIRKLLIKALS